MGIFSPFKATRYNKKVVELADVVAPPYDVIGPTEQRLLYERDAHNVVRLILNESANPYRAAQEALQTWKENGVLKHDAEDSYYVYQQLFSIGSQEFSREGVLGTLELHEYAEKRVLPHERTHPGPKADRLKLMEATGANLSPIFGLIEDETRFFDQTLELIKVRPPIIDIDQRLQEGATIRHILWRSHDEQFIARMQAILKTKQVIIADGHHRYETALEYHRQHPELDAASRMLCYISNIHGEGTVILPTHRIIHGLPNFDQLRILDALKDQFSLDIVSSRPDGLKRVERAGGKSILLEFREDPKLVVVSTSSDELAVDWLHNKILIPVVGITAKEIQQKKHIDYPHTVAEVDEFVGDFQLAAYVPPVSPSKLMEIVRKGEFMPQKTTFFYPKLLSGLVFHEFAEQSVLV